MIFHFQIFISFFAFSHARLQVNGNPRVELLSIFRDGITDIIMNYRNENIIIITHTFPNDYVPLSGLPLPAYYVAPVSIKNIKV